uniref:BPTI/Kunitz inhibitor domain-containing protein n=1 Tax=Amblyomma cajennense TaxID=34607 RepID=A0A023FG23_AMBCJ
MGTWQSLRLLAVFQVISWIHATGPVGRNKRCLQPPEMERCSVILLKWSFKEGSNKCEENFVCSEHQNSFNSREECVNVCPPIHGKKPKPEKVDCMSWLLRGKVCYRYSFVWLPNRKGERRWGMLYTGCGKWSNRLYFYDWKKRNCREIKRPSSTAE